MTPLIDKICAHLKNEFAEDSTGHDWYHIQRVYELARYIHAKEGGDLELIALGALLHDISDHKFNGGNLSKGGEVAYEMLLEYGYPEEKALKVKTIVDTVSFKGAKVPDATSTLEAKIVQDADRLDAIGAIGIARTFAYGGHVGNPIYDPELKPQLHDSFEAYSKSRSHTINHFHEKLLLLADRLHTSTAKKIGKKRTELMQNFLVSFHNEWDIKLDE